jgi:hypothetical protein
MGIYETSKTGSSSSDKIMLNFVDKVNNHSDMNVRMVWMTKKLGKPIFPELNHIDYWIGVAEQAYIKDVITVNELKEVLLALQASGANTQYFKEIVQKLKKGEYT